MAVKTKELLQVCDILNNQIPNKWKTTLVKNFAKIQNGGAFKSEFFNKTKGIRLIRIRDLTGNKLPTFYEGRFDDMYVVNSGDFLISMDGDFIGTEWTDGKALLNQRVCKIITNAKIIQPKFFRFGINQYLKKIHSATSFLTVAHLSSDTINHIDFPIPPLNEQKRIVAKIESIFTQIDATRERLEALASQIQSSSVSLNALKSSVLKQAFEGKLVPQDPNDVPAEVLLKRINKDAEFLDIVMEKELPKGWSLTTLGTILEPSNKKFNPLNQNERIFIGLEHIESHTNKIISKGTTKNVRSTKSVFNEGDVLYGKLRPYLNKVVVPNFHGVCSTDILVFPKSKIIESMFLAYFLSTKNFVKFANSTVSGIQHPRTSFKKISIYSLLLPPLNEQKRIVSKIESIFGRIDAIDKTINQSIIALDMLRQSVLKQAFEGRLVPQDPNDEPASVLLERIKNEKTSTKREKKHGK